MIPERQTDPIGYALWWLGADLTKVLQEKAARERLELRSRDVDTNRATGLRRLKNLVNRQLLRQLPKIGRQSCVSHVFVPVDFLEAHFMSEAKRAVEAVKHGVPDGQ